MSVLVTVTRPHSLMWQDGPLGVWGQEPAAQTLEPGVPSSLKTSLLEIKVVSITANKQQQRSLAHSQPLVRCLRGCRRVRSSRSPADGLPQESREEGQ